MRLSRRILDFVRARVFSWRGVGGKPVPPSPQGMPAETRETHESLARAQTTRQRLQGDLEIAEREGRDTDARLLRRQVDEISASIEQLQTALELIQSRVRAAHGQADRSAPSAPIGQTLPTMSADPGSAAASSGKPDDLEARKARLSGDR
jgi:hypothetical protein